MSVLLLLLLLLLLALLSLLTSVVVAVLPVSVVAEAEVGVASWEMVGEDCGDGDVDEDVDSVVELAYLPVLTDEASAVEAGV